MKRGLLLAALVLVALAATFASQRPGGDSPLPTEDNRGPRGIAVLSTWLTESGRAMRKDTNEPPPDVGTIVLVAPAASEYSQDEVDLFRFFVERGGTLVYLVPRQAPQGALNNWLHVSLGEVAPLNDEPGVADVGGSTVEVTGVPGLHTFRVSADRTLVVEDADEVAAHGALWRKQLGKGTVWLSAGPDLAENARLELADNARFWSRLPGPIGFDENHHRVTRDFPINFVAVGFQLLFLAALFFWANGRRLGPPRDEPAKNSVSTMNYVRALANLLRNAHVEPELVAAIKRELRALGVDDTGDDFVALSRRLAEAAGTSPS